VRVAFLDANFIAKPQLRSSRTEIKATELNVFDWHQRDTCSQQHAKMIKQLKTDAAQQGPKIELLEQMIASLAPTFGNRPLSPKK
jgi:hypothetical protein